uniref:General transcription factor 3C polypeptide 6-like isoform X2 n=1 Tax=Crassostrea virginica TaxID=6565 RepID=A0A8B8AX85_CRAVI|nr:general transcription factor 3C polypeptide 6-like isoform X2 [Crassostrea virginica]
MDSSDEWEEEEQYLMVDLHGILEPDFLQKAEGNCKVLGIGTENPYLQVDGYTFSGKYVAPIGSYLIFEEKKPLEETDENSEAEYAKSKLEYVTCLDKKLYVNRTFVTPKVSEGASGAAKAVDSEVTTSHQDTHENQNQDNNETSTESNNEEHVAMEMESSAEIT